MKLYLSLELQHLGKGVSSSLTNGYKTFKRSMFEPDALVPECSISFRMNRTIKLARLDVNLSKHQTTTFRELFLSCMIENWATGWIKTNTTNLVCYSLDGVSTYGGLHSAEFHKIPFARIFFFFRNRSNIFSLLSEYVKINSLRPNESSNDSKKAERIAKIWENVETI